MPRSQAGKARLGRGIDQPIACGSRRRMQRMTRARLGVENAHDREYDVVPSRLRRPGAVVLEIDDEDPIFEDLDYAVPARNYGWSRELPRAVGQ